MNDPTERWCNTALSGQAPERPLSPLEKIELDEDEIDARALEEAQTIICDPSLLRKNLNDEELAAPVADICDLIDGALREWADVPGLHPQLSKLLRACKMLERATLAVVNDDYLRDKIAGDMIQDLKEMR